MDREEQIARFHENVAREVVVKGRSAATVAREYGVSRKNVESWVEAYREQLEAEAREENENLIRNFGYAMEGGESVGKGEKNREKAIEMLQAGKGWTEIMREAHINGRELSELKKALDLAAEKPEKKAEEPETKAEETVAIEGTEDTKAEAREPETVTVEAAAQPVEVTVQRKKRKAAPAVAAPRGRWISDQDQMQMMWAVGVLESYMETRPEGCAGRQAARVLRRIAGMEDEHVGA